MDSFSKEEIAHMNQAQVNLGLIDIELRTAGSADSDVMALAYVVVSYSFRSVRLLRAVQWVLREPDAKHDDKNKKKQDAETETEEETSSWRAAAAASSHAFWSSEHVRHAYAFLRSDAARPVAPRTAASQLANLVHWHRVLVPRFVLDLENVVTDGYHVNQFLATHGLPTLNYDLRGSYRPATQSAQSVLRGVLSVLDPAALDAASPSHLLRRLRAHWHRLVPQPARHASPQFLERAVRADGRHLPRGLRPPPSEYGAHQLHVPVWDALHTAKYLAMAMDLAHVMHAALFGPAREHDEHDADPYPDTDPDPDADTDEQMRAGPLLRASHMDDGASSDSPSGQEDEELLAQRPGNHPRSAARSAARSTSRTIEGWSRIADDLKRSAPSSPSASPPRSPLARPLAPSATRETVAALETLSLGHAKHTPLAPVPAPAPAPAPTPAPVNVIANRAISSAKSSARAESTAPARGKKTHAATTAATTSAAPPAKSDTENDWKLVRGKRNRAAHR
jgi:hypothetical protein